jgi:hypothetical protein
LGIFGTQFVTNLYEKNVSRVVTKTEHIKHITD